MYIKITDILFFLINRTFFLFIKSYRRTTQEHFGDLIQKKAYFTKIDNEIYFVDFY